MEFVPTGMSHAIGIMLLICYFIDNLTIQSVPCQNNYKLEIMEPTLPNVDHAILQVQKI